jgi:hypothetical protein
MRWIAVLVLGACSFSPGALTSDAQPGNEAGPMDGPRLDTAVVDASLLDTYVAPGRIRAIAVEDARVTGGPHVDFPLLIALSESWLLSEANGGDVANDSGADIYFTADLAGTTPLEFEIERYVPTTGALEAWVKIPSLSSQSVFYLHYGDPAITTSRATPAEVWSASYQLVLHMAGAGDSTGKNTNIISSAIFLAAGRIGEARSFNGTTSFVNVGSETAVDNVFVNGGTAEAWFYASGWGENDFGRLFDKGNANGWSMFIDNDNASGSMDLLHGTTTGNGLAQWYIGANSVSLNAWHHVAMVYNKSSTNNDPLFYINGIAVAVFEPDQPSGAMVSDAAANLIIGNRADTERTFNGILDEMRLSSVSRSAGWIRTQYANQSEPATFYTVSAPL